MKEKISILPPRVISTGETWLFQSLPGQNAKLLSVILQYCFRVV